MPKNWDKFILWTGAIGSLLGILACFRIDAISTWDKLGKMNGRQVFLAISLTLLAVGLVLRWLDKRVTPRNVHHKIDQWLHTFQLNHREQSFEQWHFLYVVTFQGVEVFIGRPRNMFGRYLSIQARVRPLTNEQRTGFEGLNPQMRREFYTALALETAKARIQLKGETLDNLSIDRLIPITNQLSELEILESVNEMQMSVVVIQNTLMLWLSPNPNLAQISTVETTETPPALPQQED